MKFKTIDELIDTLAQPTPVSGFAVVHTSSDACLAGCVTRKEARALCATLSRSYGPCHVQEVEG